MIRIMEYRMLGKTGLKVSVLSLGASPLGGSFRPIDESEGIRTVRTALDLGINFIDVSPYYGVTRAESVLGKALREVPRDRYFLSTKVGRYDVDRFDFSAARVTSGVDESLKRLGVDFVDLIQCHDIEFGSLDQVVEETLPALRRVRDQGKARFIGITGLPLKIFTEVVGRAEIDTILSYCHYSLNDTTLASLFSFVQPRGLGVINASPVSMGLLTQRGAPDWHPAPPAVREHCARAAAFCREKGVDISQLAIQFSVRNPAIHTTLVGTADPEHIRKNVEWLGASLDEELLQEVQSILAPIKDQTWPSGRPENN